MKIRLSPKVSFWGLMDPVDLKLTLSLTEPSPLVEIDESKLYDWELKQIVGSVQDGRISISVKVEDLLKSIAENTKIKQEKKASKKATKLKA